RDIEVVESTSSETMLRLKIRRLVDVDLPGFAKRVMKPTNIITTTDDWDRADDGSYHGRQLVETQGAPVKISAETTLTAAGDQTRYAIAVHVEVKVPLIGGKLADWAKGTVRTQLDQEFAAGDAWLATRA